jgi:hypothetical protein
MTSSADSSIGLKHPKTDDKKTAKCVEANEIVKFEKQISLHIREEVG